MTTTLYARKVLAVVHPPLIAFFLSLPRPIKRLIAILVDAGSCLLAVWVAVSLHLESLSPPLEPMLLLSLVSIGLAIPIFTLRGLYRQIFRFSGAIALSLLAQAAALYGFIYFFVFSVIGISGIPKSVGLSQPLVLFLLVGASRFILRKIASPTRSRAITAFYDQPAVLVYGAGSAGQQLAQAIEVSQDHRFVAFIDDDPRLWNHAIDGRVVYAPKKLSELAELQGATDLWLAMPSLSPSRRRALIESLRTLPLRVRTLPSVGDLISDRVRLSDVRDLDLDELLGREKVFPNQILLNKDIRNKTILVTGAGGSIGSELCRQIVALSPKKLVMVDHSEYALYRIYHELSVAITDTDTDTLVSVLASVRDQSLMRSVFENHRPDVVYHAAAFKHVPMVERNPISGLLNNVWGTLECANLAKEYGIQKFVLISTDKAVRPTSVMGASKRIAELILQAYANEHQSNFGTKYTMVRFGNVLGSSGSVVPLFRRQIDEGGPITLTHPEVTRYFMSITEAAQLVIQAGAMAKGGDVFLLDMGVPVRISELARRMVELSGLSVRNESNPRGDIEIVVTGLRPGEKLYEELLIGNSPQATSHPKVMRASEKFIEIQTLLTYLDTLQSICAQGDISRLNEILKQFVPEYQAYESPKDTQAVAV